MYAQKDKLKVHKSSTVANSVAKYKSNRNLKSIPIPSCKDASVKQLMTTAYTISDYSTNSNDEPFNDQEVISFIHTRQGIPSEVKQKVDGYNDNGIGASYNHYVPYGKLYESLEQQLIKQARSRKNIVKLLESHMKNVEICETPGLTIDPLKSLVNFNTWLDAAIVAICDSPLNIYKGPHEGDGNGTKVDTPIDGTAELNQRLKMAALAFKMIGLTW